MSQIVLNNLNPVHGHFTCEIPDSLKDPCTFLSALISGGNAAHYNVTRLVSSGDSFNPPEKRVVKDTSHFGFNGECVNVHSFDQSLGTCRFSLSLYWINKDVSIWLYCDYDSKLGVINAHCPVTPPMGEQFPQIISITISPR